MLHITQAEAVRADWSSTSPPEAGWETVHVPDSWAARWPGFDGVVWYRMRWQAGDTQSVGLVLAYLNMAGSVYLNGTLISRDPSQTEPLTRAWNIPRYWLLSEPMLKQGENTLLVRVAGLAAYQPGIGYVRVGDPEAVSDLYSYEVSTRRSLPLVGLAASGILCVFFFVVWSLRREEAAYGWFALMSFAWLIYGANQIVTSPWPFATNDGWQAFNSLCFVLFAIGYFIFFMRLCERKFVWLERTLWVIYAVVGIGSLLVAPAWAATYRALMLLGGCGLVWLTLPAFYFVSRRAGTPYRNVIVLFQVVSMAAGIHDILVYFEQIDSKVYLSFLASYFLLITMALTLAWRFVASLRRIEGFNKELEHSVQAARQELAEHLRQQHDLEVRHAKLDERMNLVRDLHDGLGGTLVGNIAVLERSPELASGDQQLAVLRNLRDDLRLIIDAAAGDEYREQTLAQLLVPLRHRLGNLLEQNGIRCEWTLSGLDQCRPGAARGLDILRILQEALTNVIKHSGASEVRIRAHYDGVKLTASVADNGRGWQGKGEMGGQGMSSMQARARRLGAEFCIDPVTHKVMVTLPI